MMKVYKILLADDNPISLKLLKAVFEADYDIATAGDGLEALEILFQHKVDLVITDILMPNMDGYHLTYKIRSNERLRDIPVIIYTASYVSLSEEALAHQMGANAYIRKPAPHSVLIQKVSEILSDPGRFPHKIPSKPESAELLSQYNVKLIAKLEQNVIELTQAKEATEALNSELEKRLQEIENYKYALDESSIVAITDNKGIIKYANGLFCKISKYTKNELVGQDHRIVNSSHHSREFMRNLWATIAKGKVWKGEIKNKAKDGQYYWVNTTIVPFTGKDGKPIEYVAIRSEITEQKIAEEKLINSEMRLRQAQALAHVGSWELDLATGVATWSDEACRIFGVPVGENKQSVKAFLELIHPDDFDHVKRAIDQSNAAFKDNAIDHRIVRKDGSVRYIHTERRFEFDETGKAIGLYGITHDITDKKMAEIQREFDRNNMDALINNTGDFMWSVDRDLNLISFNRPFNDLMKHYLGRSLEKGENILSAAFSTEQVTAYKKHYERAFAGEVFSEIEYTNAPAEYWVEVSFYPIRDGDKIIGVACNSRDITERKKSENQIKFDKSNLDALINNTDNSIWSVDKEYKLITFNKTLNNIITLSLGRPLEKGADMLSYAFTQEQADIYKKFYDRVFAGESFSEIDYTAVSGGVWSEVSFYPIREGEKIIGAACQLRDITERIKAENKIKELNETLEERVQERTADLTEANKALEAFSSTVSHDLRAPVRAVNSFAKILREDYGSKMDAEEKELFGYIEENGRRMSDIIDDLLKLAKYGHEKLKLEMVDMTRLVNGVWLNISRTTPHQAMLELDQLPEAKVDMGMMQQVIVNLFSNGIKYSSKKESPVIKVWCEQAEGRNTFYFKDNGAGFDMQYLDRLFGAFQRLHTTRDFEGTGVGLALVKRIIEKHGGTVGAEGKVGEGATFYFTLPL